MLARAPVVRLHVGGMSCEHCSASVTRTLRAVPGVEDATVDHESSSAVVVGAVSSCVLIEAIIQAGFSAALAPEAVVLRAGGMMCDHCSGRVASVLRDVQGVDDATVENGCKHAS